MGVHALPVAAALLPGGALHALDVQAPMLEELERRVEARGLTNIVATLGDARSLPYSDRSFDAAYLVGVLGEIPEPNTALRELHRVLRASGRLVICELLVDPDFLSLSVLRRMASDAGFTFTGSAGPPFAYTAVFRAAAA